MYHFDQPIKYNTVQESLIVVTDNRVVKMTTLVNVTLCKIMHPYAHVRGKGGHRLIQNLPIY